MNARLLVFAKAAIPGQVKTRLVPPLTAEEAAGVHTAALLDTLAVAARAAPAGALELWVAGDAEAADAMARLVPVGRVKLQAGGGLGGRLADAFDGSFARGDDRVVIVGSDHPTLPAEWLREGFEALGEHSLVLGPSQDGGYYAVGLRRESWPAARALFRGIPWSSPAVLEATLQQASRRGLSVRLLPAWYDVDDAADLGRALRDAQPGSALAAWCAKAGSVLSRLGIEQGAAG